MLLLIKKIQKLNNFGQNKVTTVIIIIVEDAKENKIYIYDILLNYCATQKHTKHTTYIDWIKINWLNWQVLYSPLSEVLRWELNGIFLKM